MPNLTTAVRKGSGKTIPIIIQRVDKSFKKVKLDTEFIAQPDTLQTVTTNGNFTDESIYVEDLYLNQNGPDATSSIFFWDASAQAGQYLRWLDAAARFEFSTKLRVLGELEANANLALNIDAGDADSIITFYKPTSGTQTLRWDKTNLYFKFDAKLFIDGDFEVSGDTNLQGDLNVVGTITGGGISTTLQEVTDNGNTTINDIKIKNLFVAAVGGGETLITLSDAGYKDSDNTPTSGTLTWGNSALHNGDFTTQAVAASVNKDSAGLDFGTAKTPTKFRLYDANTSDDGIYAGGGYDSLSIYYSDDATNWTLLLTEDPVTRTNPGGGYHYVEIVATGAGSHRYWKLSAQEIGALAAGGGGAQLNKTEVEGYESGAASFTDGDSFVYFYYTTEDGAFLQWDFSAVKFILNYDLEVQGDIYSTGSNIFADGDLTLNNDAGNVDAIITFKKPTSGSTTIRWDKTNSKFLTSDNFKVTGTLEATGNITGAIGSFTSITTAGNATFNDDSGDVDVILTFTKASGTETLRWDKTNSYFNFSNNLHIAGTVIATGNITGAVGSFSSLTTAGNLVLNDDSGDVDVSITFTKASGSQVLKWDKTNSRFNFDTDLYVTGTVKVNTDAYLNALQANADVILNFGNGDGGNSAISLQNSDHTFHMSKSLYVNGSALELSGAGFAINTDHSNVDVNISLGVFPSGFASLRWDTALSAFRILSGSNFYFDGGLFQLNHGAGAGDVTIQFQKTSGSQNFKYSQANSRFEMDANFATAGDIVLNSDSGAVDVVLTFTKSSGSETLKWVTASTYFKFSNKLYVAGDILADGNLELNEDLTDANVLIALWKVAQTAVNTGTFAPTATATGTWTNGANVKVSDDAWANNSGFNQTMTASIFSLPAIPFGSSIVGIEVVLEGQAYGTTAGGTANVGVELSWDGGSTYSTGINNSWINTTPATTAPIGANDTNKTYGGPTTLFAGHTWIYSDFTNTNLFARLRDNGDSANTHAAVDYMTIKVYYKPPASQIFMWDKTNLWFNLDSALNIQGSLAVPFYTRTQADYSTYTLNATDFTVYADTTAGSMTITLPTAVGIAGRIYVVKKKVAANTLTLNTTSSQTIDGATSWADTDQYATLMVQSDGANWIKLSSIGTWA